MEKSTSTSLVYCDSHLHPGDIPGLSREVSRLPQPWRGVASCHCLGDLEALARLRKYSHDLDQDTRCHCSLGIHPQALDLMTPGELADLAGKTAGLKAIGECGFDFASRERDDVDHGQTAQDRAFGFQLELATSLRIGMVIHCRRGLDMIHAHAPALARLPAVVFHGWSGNLTEALKLLDRGLPARFSLGTPLLWEGRKVAGCMAGLPLDRLLLETDSPWQPRRNEEYTPLEGIKQVYAKAAELRSLPVRILAMALLDNFVDSFQAPETAL